MGIPFVCAPYVFWKMGRIRMLHLTIMWKTTKIRQATHLVYSFTYTQSQQSCSQSCQFKCTDLHHLSSFSNCRISTKKFTLYKKTSRKVNVDGYYFLFYCEVNIRRYAVSFPLVSVRTGWRLPSDILVDKQ